MFETCRRALTAQSLRVQRVDLDVPCLPNKQEDFDQDSYTQDKERWFELKCSLGYQHPSIVLVERIVDKEKVFVEKKKKKIRRSKKEGERGGMSPRAAGSQRLPPDAEKKSAGVVRRLELNTVGFFEFLFSDRWEQGCLLRVLKGKLLDDLLHALTKLERYHNVISYTTMAYLYHQRGPLQPCIKGTGDGQRTENIADKTRVQKVMVEFDVFCPQEVPLEVDEDTLAVADDLERVAQLEQETSSGSGSTLHEQHSGSGSSGTASTNVKKKENSSPQSGLQSVQLSKSEEASNSAQDDKVPQTGGPRQQDDNQADNLPTMDTSLHPEAALTAEISSDNAQADEPPISEVKTTEESSATKAASASTAESPAEASTELAKTAQGKVTTDPQTDVSGEVDPTKTKSERGRHSTQSSRKNSSNVGSSDDARCSEITRPASVGKTKQDPKTGFASDGSRRGSHHSIRKDSHSSSRSDSHYSSKGGSQHRQKMRAMKSSAKQILTIPGDRKTQTRQSVALPQVTSGRSQAARRESKKHQEKESVPFMSELLRIFRRLIPSLTLSQRLKIPKRVDRLI